MNSDTNTDRCAACGALIQDTLSDETSAHWDRPGGHEIRAWSCGGACAAEVESRRLKSGELPTT